LKTILQHLLKLWRGWAVPPAPTDEPVAVQYKSLFISAGHSDVDPGAVGNGRTEASIVLEFRDMVAGALQKRGVLFDRDGAEGQNQSLTDAVGAAKSHDIAVEFHCNAFHNPSATGVETLSDSNGYPLGEVLCTAIADVLNIKNRGAKGEGSGQHSRLAFVRKGGGIIVELFFISNANDLQSYLANRHALAEAVAEVLTDAVAQEHEDAE